MQHNKVRKISTRLIVMTERGRQMLEDIYNAPPAKIDLIAHGIPDVGFVDPTYFNDQFGVEGKVVLHRRVFAGSRRSQQGDRPASRASA